MPLLMIFDDIKLLYLLKHTILTMKISVNTSYPIVVWGSRCSCSLSATRISKDKVACENSHLSLLLAARDISPGKMPVLQRRKFNTDHVKSVRNLVRSSDWQHSSYIVFCNCLQMTDKRQQATKVKHNKHDDSITKQSILVEYNLL